jgi:hypothetical protein
MNKYEKTQNNLERQNRALLFGLALSIALNIFLNTNKQREISEHKQRTERYMDVSYTLAENLQRCEQELEDHLISH